MLSRSIKGMTRGSTYRLVRASSVAHYHHSAPLYKKAAELKEEDSSPIDKFTQGMNVIKSTILNAPPLRKITRPNIESLPFTGNSTTWDQAVKEAQSLVNSSDQERIFDPVKIIGADLWELKGNITKLLGSGHPFINTIGKHYLQGDTNRIRPLLVLLIANATSLAPKKTPQQLLLEDKEDSLSLTTVENPILPSQRRLAEISEMIYTASLLHYDVIDHSDQVTNPGFGNKLAVLAGDFLLARSSLALAQLKKAECIELIATCIANLVESEFMKLEDIQDPTKAFDYYLDKIYKKTGSLIAQSCKASAVLAGCTVDISQASYDYGKHLGIALQLFDDLQNFAQTKSKSHELVTAPLLLAYKDTPELGPIIKREFTQDGDKEQARMLVYKSNGLQTTHELANKHVDAAIAALDSLPTSDAKSALIQLARNLPTRKE